MLGTRGGKFSHTLITDELPSHTHTMASAGAHTHLISTADIFNTAAFAINDGGGDKIVSSDNVPTWYGNYRDNAYGTQSAGAHTHTINSTGSGVAHTIMQPYLVTNYIIKARPDNVITSQILVGSGINVVRNGSSQTFISLSDTTNSTLSVKHDSTLRINIGDSSLGLNNNSVNNSNLVNGAVSPEKLSTNGPSWGVEGAEVALYEGSGSSRKRVATREWVNDIVVDGPVKSLVTKNPGQRHTSAATQGLEHIYAYIDKDGVPNMAGYHEFGAIAPTNTVVGYTPYPLPLDNGIEITAEKLWIGKERILALGSNGKLYGRGRDARNDFNNINPVGGDNRYSNWVLAFTAVYSYLGQSRTIKSVIISPDDWDTNIAVIDSADALWISGDNQYGQLATGNQLQTNFTVPGSYHATPALTDVKEAVMIGTWNGVVHPVTVAAIQWTSSAKTSAAVRTVGYGQLGQMGDGTISAINTSWKTATIPPAAPNPVNCGLYVGGNDQYSSIYLVANDGSVAYGWGYNEDRGLGTDPRQGAITLPIKIWDATTNGPTAQRGREIEKFYTTSHIGGWASTYILTKPLAGGKREIWAAGVNSYNKWGTATGNDAWNLWTNITPVSRPANWSIDSFYVGNSYNQATNNFIRWKIVNIDGDVYQLEASGWSGEYSTGTGLNSGPLTTWTRVNLRSETVKTIVDCQNGRAQSPQQAFTYLLCNDGSLYYCGQSRYGSIPFGLNAYYTSNFVRIK
jgi:hypothetical protein